MPDITFNISIDTSSCQIVIDFTNSSVEVWNRYTVNCDDETAMYLRARYCFIKEFPASTQAQKEAFYKQFSTFVLDNKAILEKMYLKSREDKHDALMGLLVDVNRELNDPVGVYRLLTGRIGGKRHD